MAGAGRERRTGGFILKLELPEDPFDYLRPPYRGERVYRGSFRPIEF